MPVWLFYSGIAALGAFAGGIVDSVKKGVEPDPRDTVGNSVNPNTIIIYAGAALALAYGAKKVFNIK